MQQSFTLWLLCVACYSPLVHAQHQGSLPSDHVIKTVLIETAASMSQQTLNCGLFTEKDVLEARALQRQNFPRQLGFTTVEYDAIYANALARFNQSWAAMSAEKRLQTCQQTHLVHKDQL